MQQREPSLSTRCGRGRPALQTWRGTRDRQCRPPRPRRRRSREEGKSERERGLKADWKRGGGGGRVTEGGGGGGRFAAYRVGVGGQDADGEEIRVGHVGEARDALDRVDAAFAATDVGECVGDVGKEGVGWTGAQALRARPAARP